VSAFLQINVFVILFNLDKVNHINWLLRNGLNIACFIDTLFNSGKGTMERFILCLLAFAFSQNASATIIDGIYIFGDSLSDSGVYIGNPDE
jgi:hypothetical protein